MMKNWKKKAMVVLSLIGAVVVFAACGNKQGNSSKSNELTIGVWGGNSAEEKALDDLISHFEKENNVKIQKKVYTDYNTQIQADLVGKTAPDVFYVDSNMYPFFAQNKALLELDADKFDKDKFYSNLIDAFSTDGKLYAVPKDLSTLAVYLNTDIFEKAGVSLDEVPNSLEEYVTWLPEFQKKIDAAFGTGKVFAMSYTPELSRQLHLAQRNDADIETKDGKANLANKKVVDNLSIMTQLAKTNAMVSPQDVGTGWNGEAFGTGKIAIMDEGNWVYQTLKDEFSTIPFTVRQMPLYKNEKGTMMFSVGWGIYAGTKNQELAEKWVQYVTGKDGMQLWVEGTGTLPSRQDVAEAAKITENPDLNVHLEEESYATIWQKGVTLPTISNAYNNYITKVMSGDISMEEGMKSADEQANSDIESGK